MNTLIELLARYGALWLLALIVLVSGGLILAWRWLRHNGARLHRCGRALRQQIGRSRLIAPLRIHHPYLWHFLHRRLSPSGYLGLHLTLGLGILVGALLVFAELIEELWEDASVVRFDLALVEALQRHVGPATLELFSWITRLGDVAFLVGLGLLAGLVLALRRHWLLLASWAVTLIGGGLLNNLLKEIFQRARPTLENPFMIAAGWSFPSGHAMGSLFAYGMLAYILLRSGPHRWRLPVLVLTVALILAIGASRVLLQVHYFSDIIAGYAAGAAWLAVCITGAELALRRRARRP